MSLTVEWVKREFGLILTEQRVSVTHVPENKASPNSRVIGTIEDPVTQSLYSLSRRIVLYVSDYLESLVNDDMDKIDFHKHHLQQMVSIGGSISSMVKVAVRDQFPDITKLDLEYQICKNWEVTVCKKDPDDLSSKDVQVIFKALRKLLENTEDFPGDRN